MSSLITAGIQASDHEFKFRKPKPDGSWLGPLEPLVNDAQDNLFYAFLVGIAVAILLLLIMGVIGIFSGNMLKLKKVGSMLAAAIALLVVGLTYTGVLQGIVGSA